MNKRVMILVLMLIVILAVAWLTGRWLTLTGADLWIVRSAILSIGVCALALYWFYMIRRTGQQLGLGSSGGGAAAGGGGAAGGAQTLDLAFREAESRLATSRLGKQTRISALPGIVVIGDSGSAKTTTVMQSGLEAELLAGQSIQGSVVAPTEGINVWLGHGTVFLDVGGKQLQDPKARAAIVRKMAPATSVVGSSQAAPRAAIVCQDAEAFIRQGGAEATLQAANRLREVLNEISLAWGVQLPVYVLFTRMDRIPFFTEYVGSLSTGEAAMVLGRTLPMSNGSHGGVYADAQSARLSEAFDEVVFGCADKRTEYLDRERESARLSGVYQFPRELRKLKNLMVQYMVQLARPSQLHAGPFLRGFYFTGVRPVIVSDVAAARRPSEKEPVLADATGIFLHTPSAPDAAHQPTARKVPQWVFLRRLFGEVVLKDSAALGSSVASVKTSLWRRVLLAAACFLGAFLLVAWTVSFFRNRALAAEVEAAAKAVPMVNLADGALAPPEALQKLDGLREIVARLRDYDREGAPWSYRWGLYTGDRLYPAASRIYFGHFRRMLLEQTQRSLLALTANPQSAGTGIYKPVYEALKAYLITTSHPDKSTREFLPPVLLEHWLKNRQIDPGHQELAMRQFEFYSIVLPERQPYPSFATPDEKAVATARQYLSRFAATETLYQAMVAAANQKFPSIQFNAQYPGSAEVIRNNYPVPGAFTKPGYAFMQEAIKNPDQFFAGERWVMGEQNFATVDKEKLKAELAARYQDDFLNNWRTFLRETSVVRFGLADAPVKLAKLSDIQSPLLMVLCVASTNTSIDDKQIAEKFQPPQFVTPDGCREKLTGPSNAAYMENLLKLKGALQNAAGNPTNETLKTEAISTATNAQISAQLVAQNFKLDQEANLHQIVRKVLEDPIVYAINALGAVDKEAVNAKGRDLCNQLRPLLAKYPFNPKATVEASLDEVGSVFAPGTGLLWQLYEGSLTKVIQRQGNSFVAVPGGTMSVNPQFLSFFQRAADVSRAFYRGGSPQAQLAFAMKHVPTEGIQSVTLQIHGQTLQASGAGQPMQFTWPGTGQPEVKMAVRIAGGSPLNYPSYSGTWALWRFFSYAEPAGGQSGDFSLAWTLRTAGGVVTIPESNRPVVVRFDLDMLGAPPVLRPGYLSSLNCVVPAVR